MMKKNQWIKTIILNVTIVALGIICYSPGLLGLRITDSIFRAGCAIIMAPSLTAAFFAGNYMIFRKEQLKFISTEDVSTIDQAIAVLKTYRSGKHFGATVNTIIEQLQRLNKSIERANFAANAAFTAGTMTGEKYMGIISAGGKSALNNIIAMTNRMRLFDEKEYERLQHYKEDDIPDDIQEQQIELYHKNMELIQQTISLNERIILKLDTLSMELGLRKQNYDDTIIEEIARLTEEAKLYQ